MLKEREKEKERDKKSEKERDKKSDKEREREKEKEKIRIYVRKKGHCYRICLSVFDVVQYVLLERLQYYLPRFN